MVEPPFSRTAGAKKDRIVASKDQREEFIATQSRSQEFIATQSRSQSFTRSPQGDPRPANRSGISLRSPTAPEDKTQNLAARDKKDKLSIGNSKLEDSPQLERAPSAALSSGSAQPEEEANPEFEQQVTPEAEERAPEREEVEEPLRTTGSRSILKKSQPSSLSSPELTPEQPTSAPLNRGASSESTKTAPSKLKLKKKVSMKNPRVNSTSFMGRVSEHPYFEACALVVILCNAVWIGVDTDFNDPDDEQISSIFFFVENVFCALFTFELFVRFCSYYKCTDFFRDPMMLKWNLFDFVLVAIMIIETWILPVMGGSGSFSQLSSLRLLRLLRISRIFRMVPELGMMVKSMVAAVRSVSSTFLLAVGIMYVFAIILTQWARELEVPEQLPDENSLNETSSAGQMFMNITHCPVIEEDDEPSVEEQLIEAWGTIPRSFLSLMQIIVFDDTFSLIRTTMVLNLSLGFVLILFILIASFTVLNMLIGVICEIVSSTTADEKEKMLRVKVEDIFGQIDVDGSGTISRAEFESQDAAPLMKKLGIEQVLLDNAFDILDNDMDDNLEAREFVEMIFKLLNPPQSQDVLIIHRKIDKLKEALKANLRLEGFKYKGQERADQMKDDKYEALDCVCDFEERLTSLTQSIPTPDLMLPEPPSPPPEPAPATDGEDTLRVRFGAELESLNQVLAQLQIYLSSGLVDRLQPHGASSINGHSSGVGDEERLMQLIDDARSGVASASNVINAVQAEVQILGQERFPNENEPLLRPQAIPRTPAYVV